MIRNAFRFLFAVVLVVALLPAAAAPAAAVETNAREAILMDFDTGHVLFARKPDQSMPPASMSKIMTVYAVFERLKQGELSLDDKFLVSEKAWRKGGSKMFVEVGNEVRVEDLLRGVIVQSGNDASIVLAEGIAGSEDAFAGMLTAKADELGMDNSKFENATGWPDPQHRTTARDLAILAKHIIQDFPEYYHYFSETEFTWNDIRQHNRNPLLGRNIGVDGLKTGHTQNAGYGLTASAERDGRRLILVVTGLDSAKARAQEAAKLLEWGFREFDNYELFEAGETVEEAAVWLGEDPRVPLVAPEDLMVTLQRSQREAMEATVTYESPIPAPIEKGERLATVRITAPEREAIEMPLEAGAAVGQLGPLGRIVASVKFLVFGAP